MKSVLNELLIDHDAVLKPAEFLLCGMVLYTYVTTAQRNIFGSGIIFTSIVNTTYKTKQTPPINMRKSHMRVYRHIIACGST